MVVTEGKLRRANWKSIDDECPSVISRSNRPIALFIQKINVNTNKKKTKTKKIKASALEVSGNSEFWAVWVALRGGL